MTVWYGPDDHRAWSGVLLGTLSDKRSFTCKLHRSLATLMITFVLSLVGMCSSTSIKNLMAFLFAFLFFFNINLFILIGGFLFFSYPVRRLTRPPRVRLGVIRGLSGDTGAQHWYQHCCHWVDFVKHSNLIYIFNVQLIDYLILFLPVFLSLG